MNISEIKRDLGDNQYIRAVFFLIRAWQKYKSRKLYEQSEYPEKIRRFHNCHAGKKCYIIGNGPSLTSTDLELIKDDYSIATNKIYNVFGVTSWRPSYYLCEDTSSIVEEIADDIEKIQADHIFLNWAVRDKIGKKNNISYCNLNPYYIVNIWNYKGSYISEDCSKIFSWASTVTFSAIQLAIYMGFSEIYLLGVDFSYLFYRDERGLKHCTDEKVAHFNGGGYQWVNYLNRTTNENGYRVAKEYCDRKQIIIKNATRGGKLEVFDRIDLEKTLQGYR